MSTNGTTSEKERYQVYLAGREWGLLKQQVKARSGGICERCKINPSDAVHHLTYERKYHERLEDLQDTCEACHRYTHGLSDEDPLTTGFTPVTLTGVFESPCRIFVFFHNDKHTDWLPDSELYIWTWSYRSRGLIEVLMGDDFQRYPCQNRIGFQALLGRKYRVVLSNDAIEVGSLAIDKSRERGVADVHLRSMFSVSTSHFIDASY